MSGEVEDLSLSELLASVRARKPDLQKPVLVVTWDPVKRRWLAVMHLLGASFRQLAKATGRQAQSIYQSVEKEIPRSERAAARVKLAMSWEELSHYTEEFYKRSGEMMALSPGEATKLLHEAHPYKGE